MSEPLPRGRSQAGLAYLEVLLATVLLALLLVPALEALEIALRGSEIQENQLALHYRAASRLEEVLAQRFSDLEAAAAAAGGAPSSYSDPPATPDRRLVYVLGYDGDDADGDGDPSTGTDPGLLLVRVEIENSARVLESLTTE